MPSERIGGVRINLEACTQQELINLEGYIGARLLDGQQEFLLVQETRERRFPQEPEVV